jgi:serine/threonine protein kinase
MLESEVAILKQIEHPNVIKCFDVFVTCNNCYIVTEYCEGGDLMAILKKHKKTEPMTEEKSTRIIKEVLAGFKYLTQKAIVHRDLKPANIFFRNGVAKIADFGFAKKLEHLRHKESYNVGTPLYMPPEALVYSKYSFQSDIFSMGVLIYEILYCHAPWESRSEKELIAKMTKNPLTFDHEIPLNQKEMIQGCLAIDLSSRFTVEKLFSCEYVQNLFGNPE